MSNHSTTMDTNQSSVVNTPMFEEEDTEKELSLPTFDLQALQAINNEIDLSTLNLQVHYKSKLHTLNGSD